MPSPEVKADYTPDKLAKIAEMHDPSNMGSELAAIGNKAAAIQIKPEHFPQGFD